MFGLTNLGVVHTAISLVAVAAGIVALMRDHRITLHNRVGQVYVLTTVLTCLTGFGIFQQGGFGVPHVLGIITLVVLGVAAMAGTGRFFGGMSRYVEALSYSATFFFHLIPGVTETTTRIPAGAPLIADRNGPELQMIVGLLFVGFLVGSVLQFLWLRGRARNPDLVAKLRDLRSPTT